MVEKTVQNRYNRDISIKRAAGRFFPARNKIKGEWQMKRLLSAALALCLLLAGCSGGGGGAAGTAENAGAAATPGPAAPPAAETLNVYYEQENAAAAKALEAYAADRGAVINTVEDPAQAGLAVLAGEPGETGAYRDFSGDSLLSAAARRAGLDPAGCVSLPMGKTLYAYWADTDLLGALLGGDFNIANMQNATWEEWSAFVDTLAGWIAEPGEAEVTLSGVTYTLPAEKPEAAASLNGVFALAGGADAFTGAAYSAALVAAGGQQTDEALAGPLAALLNCFELETDHMAGPDGTLARGPELPRLSVGEATALLGGGQALFYRGRLTDATTTLDGDFCQHLAPVPQKCPLTEEEVAAPDYNVAGLLNYPVLVSAGRLAIPAAADESAAKAAGGFIVWLYASGAGTAELTDSLGMITPWNTASDTTALGAMQVKLVSTGVIPGAELADGAMQAAKAAMEGPLTTADWKNTTRADFIAAAEQALGVAVE